MRQSPDTSSTLLKNFKCKELFKVPGVYEFDPPRPLQWVMSVPPENASTTPGIMHVHIGARVVAPLDLKQHANTNFVLSKRKLYKVHG